MAASSSTETSAHLKVLAWAVDPRTVLRSAQDDYEIAAGVSPHVARDISDIGGTKEYERAKEQEPRAADGSRRAFGSTCEEARLGASWGRARYVTEGDVVVPWFRPITRVLHVVRNRRVQGGSCVRASVGGRGLVGAAPSLRDWTGAKRRVQMRQGGGHLVAQIGVLRPGG